MKSVFAYTRVSTVRQGTQGSSLLEQKAAIERYAATHHLRITEWFEEQETAAKLGRPVFSKMIKLLINNKATGVVIHKIDRSARNLKDWADLGELVDRGIEIHLAHESLDLNSRGGRLAADIQAVVAADYVRNLRQEVIKGIQGRLKQGLLPWPAPPGYINQGGGLPKIPDPLMAPLVRRLFEMYATGNFSFGHMIVEAQRIGFRGRRGISLSKNGLTSMFNNEFYIGIIHHKVSGERFTGIHEPIIPTLLFEQVQAVLRSRHIKKTTKHEFSYRRFIRCAACAHFLVAERQKGHVYYRCHTPQCKSVSIREEQIDEHFGMVLRTIALPAHALADLRDEFAFLMKEKFGTREHVRKTRILALRQIEHRLQSLTDRYLDGDLDRESFLARKSGLVADQIGLREALEEIDNAGRPVGTKFEQFFELQKRLLKRENRPKSAELVQMVEIVSSNRSLVDKNLLIDWKHEYFELQNWNAVPDGCPKRDSSRTKDKQIAEIQKLAKRLFDIFDQDSVAL